MTRKLKERGKDDRDLLDSLEVYELKEEVSEEDLAIAETVLANLLVRHWLTVRKPEKPAEASAEESP